MKSQGWTTGDGAAIQTDPSAVCCPLATPKSRSLQRRLRLRLYHLLYDQLAWAYDAVSWLVSLGQWHDWRCLVLDYVAGDAVLEIGFGTGELLAEASRRGRRMVGLDFSPAMHTQARRKLAAGLSQPLVQADVRCSPFRSGAFDTILSTFPAEFILEPAAWCELYRLLRPGGRLIVVGIVVYLDHPLQRFLARLLPGGKPSHAWERCVEAASQAGFETTVEIRAARWSRAPVLIAARPGDR